MTLVRPSGGMADTLDLGSSTERCAGSSPVSGTNSFFVKGEPHLLCT